MSDELNALPPGWEWASLRDVCDIERGVTFPASAKSLEIQDGYIVCLRTANVQEEVDWDDLIYIPEEYVKKDTKFLCLDDILISMANSLELVGKVSYVDSLPAESTFGGFISAIRVKEGVESKYLFYYLRFGGTQAILRDTASRSVNIANLSLRGIYPTPVAVAPLAEQRRIVEKIEALFAQSRTARQALDAIPPLIQQFRQSVLAAAFRGDLTERDPDDEPASALLERIREERRRRWEEDLIAQGKDPSRRKYKEPELPDTSGLPELPEGWCWASYNELTTKVTSGSRDWKTYLDRGTGIFILVQNIRDGRIDLELPIYVSAADDAAKERTRIEDGDILITIVGNTGVTALAQGLGEAYVSQSVALTRPIDLMDRRYLELYFSSTSWGQGLLKEKEYGMGRGHLLLSHIKECPVVVAPYSEQREISKILARYLQLADVIELTVDITRPGWRRSTRPSRRGLFAGGLSPRIRQTIRCRCCWGGYKQKDKYNGSSFLRRGDFFKPQRCLRSRQN